MTGTNGHIPSWARVGAKVVCVNAAPGAGRVWHDDAPKVGAIYTIARVFMNRDTHRANAELVELKRHPDVPAYHGYALLRFRPLVDDEIEATIYRAKGLHSRSPRNAEVDA